MTGREVGFGAFPGPAQCVLDPGLALIYWGPSESACLTLFTRFKCETNVSPPLPSYPASSSLVFGWFKKQLPHIVFQRASLHVLVTVGAENSRTRFVTNAVAYALCNKWVTVIRSVSCLTKDHKVDSHPNFELSMSCKRKQCSFLFLKSKVGVWRNSFRLSGRAVQVLMDY